MIQLVSGKAPANICNCFCSNFVNKYAIAAFEIVMIRSNCNRIITQGKALTTRTAARKIEDTESRRRHRGARPLPGYVATGCAVAATVFLDLG